MEVKLTESIDLELPIGMGEYEDGEFVTVPIGERVDMLGPIESFYLVKYGELFGLISLVQALRLLKSEQGLVNKQLLLSKALEMFA